MKYNGKLYGKVGGIYFDTGLTSNDWDELESKVNENYKFTNEDVERIIKSVISETTQGLLEFIKEETDIIDIETKQVIPNCELELKDKNNTNSLIMKYVYPRLEKHGIFIND